MGSEQKAQQVYEEGVGKFRGFRESTFFRDNPDFLVLAEGYGAIVQFLIDRPAMLVDDISKPDKLIGFMFFEEAEAKFAEHHETREDYFKELGDTGFFALLIGGLFWDKLRDCDRESVVETLKWSQNQAKEHDLDLNNAVLYVAKVKNVANYRPELHQLVPNETVDSVTKRVPEIRTLHQKLRKELNGNWAGAGDLLVTLANYWLHTLATDEPETVKKVERLFELTQLDLLSYVEN